MNIFRALIAASLALVIAIQPITASGFVGAGFHPRPQSGLDEISTEISGGHGGPPLQVYSTQALADPFMDQTKAVDPTLHESISHPFVSRLVNPPPVSALLYETLNEHSVLDEFDRANYHWDGEHWRSNHIPHLVLGTSRDLERNKDASDLENRQRMVNQVAIRLKAGFTIYAVDDDKWAVVCIKEAQARGEVPEKDNDFVMADQHYDYEGNPRSPAGVQSLRGWFEFVRDQLNHKNWVNALADDRTVLRHWRVYNAGERYEMQTQDALAMGQPDDPDQAYVNEGGLIRGYATATRCGFHKYWELPDRPRNKRVIFKADTDASEDPAEITDFLEQLKTRDGVTPSVAIVAYTTDYSDRTQIYGSFEVVCRLARDWPLLFKPAGSVADDLALLKSALVKDMRDYPEIMAVIAGTKPTAWYTVSPTARRLIELLGDQFNLSIDGDVLFNKMSTPLYLLAHREFLASHGMELQGEGEAMVRYVIQEWSRRHDALVQTPAARAYLDRLKGLWQSSPDRHGDEPGLYDLIEAPDEGVVREARTLIALQEFLIGYGEETADARSQAGGGDELVRHQPEYIQGVKAVEAALDSGKDVLDIIRDFRSWKPDSTGSEPSIHGAVGAWTWIGLRSVVWMGVWEALATTAASFYKLNQVRSQGGFFPDGNLFHQVVHLSWSAAPMVGWLLLGLYLAHLITGVAQPEKGVAPVRWAPVLSFWATLKAGSSFLAIPLIALGLLGSPVGFVPAALIGVGLHPLLNWVTTRVPAANPAGENVFPLPGSTLPRQALSKSDPVTFARVKAAWEVIRDYTVIRDPLPEGADGLFVFGSDLVWLPLAAVKLARRIPITRTIFSGGIGRHTPPAWRGSSEGEVYAEVARRLGLKAKAEEKSRTTWQNALYSLNLMGADGNPMNDVIVMQSPFAMRRAMGDVRHQLIEKFGERGRSVRIHGWAPFVPSFDEVPAGWTRGKWEWRLLIDAYMEVPRYINYQKKGFIPVDPVPHEVIEAAIVLGEFFNDDQQKTLLPAEFYDSTLENNAVGALETLQRELPSAPSVWQRRSPVKDSPAPRWDRQMRAWGPNPWRQFIARFVSWTHALNSRLEVREREILEQWSLLSVAARPAAYAEIRGLARCLGGPAHEDAALLRRIKEAV